MVFKKEDIIDYFEFYKTPKALIKDEKLREMSFGAKILYCILLDRLNISIKNNWHDEFGVYQYFTVKELMHELNCSDKTVTKLKKELNKYNLIVEKRQFNGPNKIYVEKITNVIKSNVIEHNTKRNRTSYDYGEEHHTITEENSLLTNKNNINKTNINNNDINNSCSSNIYIESKKTTTATADNSLKNLFDYYQERIGLIDSFQYQSIVEYIEDDKMDIEVVKSAIGKAADNGKRNFKYLNSILKNWKQNGIKTLAQVEDEERSYLRKVKNNKHGSDHSGIYDPTDVDLLF